MNAHSDAGERAGGRQVTGMGRLPVPIADGRGRAESAADSDEALQALVERARRIVDGQPDPYRTLAFSALLDHFLRAGPPPVTERTASAAPSAPPSTDMEIAEFLAQRRIDSHPDRIVAIAYYHYHRHDGVGVSTKDLVDGYAKARAKRPQNYPDVIASCMRKGYLVEGSRRDGMKTWVITRTGESHVEHDM